MDNLVLSQQKRVKFSSPERKKKEESEARKQRVMGRDYDDIIDGEFATAVAAAAFAVHSLDQAEKMNREAREASRVTVERPSSGKPTRLLSNKEAKNAAEILRKRSVGIDERATPKAPPTKQPSRSPANPYPTQRAMSRGHNGVESRVESWEKDHMRKVQNRYDKTKSAILEWENERKMRAKLKMEKKKGLLEQKRAQNMQHYQNKLVRIEQIAAGARAQLEEKRRNEESATKETAKKMRSRRNAPVKYFCFTC